MTVELACIAPVMLLVMAILVDGTVFAGDCARFDQLVPQQILACASSPAQDGYAEQDRIQAVQDALAVQFCADGQSVCVSVEDANVAFAHMTTYHCTLREAPWPISAVPGAPLAFEHTVSFVIAPYTPGAL